MGTIVTAVALACIVGLVIRRMIQDKRSGKSHCGCDCGQCGGCAAAKRK